MNSMVGIFTSQAQAESAATQLKSIGIKQENLSLLTPASTEKEIHSVPVSEAEQPGMGKAVGGLVGGAIGTAGGLGVGTAVASVLVPGVGTVMAIGLGAAAALGILGIAGGSAAGETLEDASTRGLPADEVFLYEDALRRGRTVLVAFTEEAQVHAVHSVMKQAGAESLDAARERWWIGLRDAEEQHYAARDGNFRQMELIYRTGFQAALQPQLRGKSYENARPILREHYPDISDQDAFQRGYARGQAYHQELKRERPGLAA